MIRFRCKCGQGLEAPETESGGVLQCPRCGLLRDIPYLEELKALRDDGTLRLADDGEAPPQRPNVYRRDAPNRLDGPDVDRRLTLDQILRVGAPADPPRQRPPRYDPETGEEVTAFDLADEDSWTPPVRPAPPPAAPAVVDYAPASARVPEASQWLQEARAGEPAALREAPLREAPLREAPPREGSASEVSQAQGRQPPTLGYAAGGAVQYGRFLAAPAPIPLEVRPVHWYSIPLELLQPQNALVLGFVFGMYLLIQGFMVLSVLGAYPLVLAALVLVLAILAHYVVVIDETGPERRDEVPSVLRNVSMTDDFFRPLIALGIAFLLCFGLPIYIGREIVNWLIVRWLTPFTAAGFYESVGGGTMAVVTGLGLIGLVMFPATLLTAATSGVYVNLAPHRIFGVIRAAPLKYALAVLVLILAIALNLLAIVATGYLTLALTNWIDSTTLRTVISAAVGYSTLFLAVYVTHWFGWLLGKIYQEHHEEFGWAWQRHISTRRDATKILERQKAAQLQASRDERSRQAQERVRSRLASPP